MRCKPPIRHVDSHFRSTNCLFPHFEVAAESGDWIVVDKGAPLIVHPSNGKRNPASWKAWKPC